MKSKIIMYSSLVVIIIITMLVMVHKPYLNTITDEELNEVYGIKVTWIDGSVKYGTVATNIKSFLEENPKAKVEDLRIIKGVDDMIIDQLKRHYK